MFLAQCPHCKTIFQTEFSVLAPHGGQVSCGECQQRFNALDNPYTPPADEKESQFNVSSPSESRQEVRAKAPLFSATLSDAGFSTSERTQTPETPHAEKSSLLERPTETAKRPDLSFLLIDTVSSMPPFSQESVPLEADPVLREPTLSSVSEKEEPEISGQNSNRTIPHERSQAAEEPVCTADEQAGHFDLRTSHDATVTASEGEPANFRPNPDQPEIVDPNVVPVEKTYPADQDDSLLKVVSLTPKETKEDFQTETTITFNEVKETNSAPTQNQTEGLTLSPDEDPEVDDLLKLLKENDTPIHEPKVRTQETYAAAEQMPILDTEKEEEKATQQRVLSENTETSGPFMTKWTILGLLLLLVLFGQLAYFFRDSWMGFLR